MSLEVVPGEVAEDFLDGGDQSTEVHNNIPVIWEVRPPENKTRRPSNWVLMTAALIGRPDPTQWGGCYVYNRMQALNKINFLL